MRALADTVPRMQTLAIQPLDLLPPCAVTFRDYALAVLRVRAGRQPDRPDRLSRADARLLHQARHPLQKPTRTELLAPAPVFKRPPLDVFHPIDAIAASRGGAYRFLDDNRAKLLIPLNADIVVTEIVRASKLTRDGRSLPEQIIVQYIWREEVLLEGERFGRFAGERTTMLCGATMVLDQNGNQIHWARKPGSASVGNSDAAADGAGRRREAARGASRHDRGAHRGGHDRRDDRRRARPARARLAAVRCPARSTARFASRSRRISRSGGDADNDDTGDRQWQISF